MISQPPSMYYIGRVLPEYTHLTIPDIPEIATVLPSGQKVSIQIVLENAVFRVRCQMQSPPKQMWELYWGVSEICYGFIDLASFTQGVGLILVIDKFIDPDGNEQILGLLHPNLKALVTAPLTATFKAVIENWPLRWTLHELAYTLKRPSQIAATCARSVERIGHALAPEGDKAQRWAAMQNNLNCSKNYLTLITEISKSPRHGGKTEHGEVEVQEVRCRAWIVVNRYLEFIHRGGKTPLPVTHFPVL